VGVTMVSLYEKEKIRLYEIIIIKSAFRPQRKELTGG
jgi:hypothetical protein